MNFTGGWIQRQLRVGGRVVAALLVIASTLVVVIGQAAQPAGAANGLNGPYQFPTAVSGAVNTAGTITFGTSGVTAALGSTTGGCGAATNNQASNATLNNFSPGPWWTPTDPSDAVGIAQCLTANTTATRTVTLSKPVIGLTYLESDIDASTLDFGPGSSGGAIQLTRSNGTSNAQLLNSGTRIASTNPAGTSACSATPGATSATCASFVMTEAGQPGNAVKSFTTTNKNLSAGADGWAWTLAFPTVQLSKSFSPSSLIVGQVSHLTFTIPNTTSSTLTPLDFTDVLPSGLSIADSTTSNNGSCGTPTLASSSSGPLGANSPGVTATNLTIASGATCTITVDATSSSISSYTNNNSNLSSTIGNLVPNANATVTFHPSSLTCPSNTVFGFNNVGATSQLYSINLGTGASQAIGTPYPSTASAIGITPNGSTYFVDSANNVVRYDVASDTYTTVANMGQAATAGAFDPANGLYYFAATYNYTPLWAYDPVSNTAFQVGALPSGASGDMAFDSSGQLLVTNGSTIYHYAPPPTVAGTNPLTPTTLGTATTAAGIAFAPDGSLAVINGASPIRQYNPISGALTATDTFSGGMTGITDLASCNSTADLTVVKTLPGGRITATDQFTVGITSGSVTDSFTTTGSGTTATGSLTDPVVLGSTYSISDAWTSGTYAGTYSCVDTANGNAVVASGTTMPGTITIPTGSANTPNIQCTVTNNPSLLSCAPTAVWTLVASNFQTFLYQVNSSTGTAQLVGTYNGIANALAVRPDGTAAYMVDVNSQRIIEFNPLTDTFTDVGAAGTAPITGAIDPVNDIYYYGINNVGKHLFAFDTNTNTSIGSVGVFSASAGGNGDILFGSDGTGYSVSALLYRFTAPTTPGNGNLTMTAMTTVPNDASDGLAFGGDGFIYGTQNNSPNLLKIDPVTLATVATIPISYVSGSTPLDAASCGGGYVLSLQKAVPAGRYNATDQFNLSVTGGNLTSGNTATTTGSGTTATGTAGPNLVDPGSTYTIGETAASGSLANYTSSWQCVDALNGNAVVASGSGSSGTFPYPSTTGNGRDVVCTITNIPDIADLSVTKTDGVTTVGTGNSTTYTITVTNAGTATITGATLADPAITGLTKAAISCSTTPGQCTTSTTPTIAQLEAGYTLPAIGPNQTYQINVAATITAAPGDHIANTATVTPPNGVSDATAASATDTDQAIAPVAAPTPTTPSSVPQGPLAFTGGNTTPYLLGAITAILLGLALLLTTRRRNRRR